MFVVFDHFYSVLCLLLGMVTALKRLLIIIFALVFSFWRLDLSWISMMDSGHSSFNAVLMCQHHFNNPVVMVFCDQVFKEINARRKAKKLHARPRSDWYVLTPSSSQRRRDCSLTLNKSVRCGPRVRLACPIPCSVCCCCMPCCCRGQLQPGEGAFVAGPNTWLKTAPESSRGLVDDVEANQVRHSPAAVVTHPRWPGPDLRVCLTAGRHTSAISPGTEAAAEFPVLVGPHSAPEPDAAQVPAVGDAGCGC